MFNSYDKVTDSFRLHTVRLHVIFHNNKIVSNGSPEKTHIKFRDIIEDSIVLEDDERPILYLDKDLRKKYISFGIAGRRRRRKESTTSFQSVISHPTDAKSETDDHPPPPPTSPSYYPCEWEL
ncbi:hypothetical protein CEXT_64821 [Caerostris extrusa]|uniref:Uncharacterized protein n=1 Tax=Caerostris extrusa TaxID=172846 RepID=A0AAV4Y8R4_CAEEX|nr:hypothetical protein CEXT_64821 [Caerostris extrusa]